jgi:hypothetical protein
MAVGWHWTTSISMRINVIQGGYLIGYWALPGCQGWCYSKCLSHGRHFRCDVGFGLSGVTLTPPAKNLVEVRNSNVLQIFVSLCFFVIFSVVFVIFEWKRRLWPSKWYIICAYWVILKICYSVSETPWIYEKTVVWDLIEHLHVTSYMTLPTAAAMLEVFFSRRAGRFNGNNFGKRPKTGHFSGPIETFQCIKSNRGFDVKIWKVFIIPSFRFSWKLKKLCRFDFFCFWIVADRGEIAR